MYRSGGRTPGRAVRRGAARAAAAAVAALLLGAGELPAQCSQPVVAKVVAIEQHVWYNRLGAREPEQLMFVLEQDLVSGGGGTPSYASHRLRDGKRPRPLALRVNAGRCLKIEFRNWLHPGSGGLGTPTASVHVMGMQLVETILDDGSNVAQGQNSLVGPGQSATYTLFAEREGTYLMYSTAQTTGGEGDGGQIAKGLFGAVNVEPAGAEWYRSQLTRADLDLATVSTSAGYPVIDYDAVYPPGHPLAGRPILRMLQNGVIVHGDLNAIITGPGRGNFPPSSFPNPGVPVYNEFDSRLRPFREFTVIFHDEVGLVQAFDSIFTDRKFEYTLHGARDAFAINYGTGGIGAEILANRFGLGPMGNCNECKFEEFFLSSWVVGDPAMVVDVPAAADFSPGAPPPPGPRATRVHFPDDPSNVFHSYLNDHVKIRNLHAGPKEHHVFHLHAHQWLHTPESGESNYLDSQAIGPGGGYTYEVTYGGGGNRNETPGDAILHCHFYPHFAQGMWGLWRVHDVFERGTVLGPDGRPAAGSRALPDGEIATGTPIPAVVPLPTYALAPLPTSTMPGYPFYIPGVAGHRAPKPPLDTQFDGGLPRHVVTGGTASFPMPLDTKDFHKADLTLAVQYLPETGTPLERQAMDFHALPFRTTPIAGTPSATGQFRLNGLRPRPGAPFADPCGLRGEARGTPLTVRAAAIQLEARYNKAEWKFGQHRMFSLWADVADYLHPSDPRAPEPLFFRAHDDSCITYHLVNLVPDEYAQDDFQVRTPTDVIGQHIHLVKFDVTSSDGAANGFNYEDGSLSPADVRHRIDAIRAFYDCDNVDHPNCPGDALPHPYFGAGPGGAWVGAQETVQRWWVDPVLRPEGTSPLGAVFTHDHFGPSTHQQAGLYAALIPEEKHTTWRDPETGSLFGGRFDGGPTSWRADILHPDPDSSFREFNLQVADFTLAYGREGFDHPSPPYLPPINPPGKDEVGLPHLLRPPFVRNGGPPGRCPNGVDTPPCPEIISADDPGTMAINYRNEPIALRIRTPGNQQATGRAGDLSSAFSSDVVRADPRLNDFGPYGPRPGELRTDPFTPLLRVYEDDRIRMNLLVGAHEEGHNIDVRGTRWLFEPRDPNSGWRNSQAAMISEYHRFSLTPLIGNPEAKAVDFLYESAATDDRWNGTWGLLRMYRYRQSTLCVLNDSRCSGEGALAIDEGAAEPALAEDTGEPLALSLRVALSFQGGDRAVVEGFDSLEVNAPLPDPADPGSWFGDLAALRAAEAADPRHSGAAGPGTAGIASHTWTPADSVHGGYGNRPIGGFDYDQFEWDPNLMEGRATTSIPPPASSGFTYAGTLTYIQQPPGMPGDYEMAGDKWTNPDAGFDGVCPSVAPVRFYDVTAIDAQGYLPGGRLVYNSRPMHGGPLVDEAAILYVFTADLQHGYPTDRPDPLVLRANAGECILVRLRNGLERPLLDPVGWNTLPPIVDRFNSNVVRPSARVGLHPQLVAYDVFLSDGSEVGINDDTTVEPGQWRWYTWYAGDVRTAGGTLFRATPIEFGATNLMSSDPIEHASKGAIGALVIEPRRSTHHMDPGRRVMATIARDDGTSFRELVLLWQDDLNLQFGNDARLPRFDCEVPYDSREEKEHCEQTGGDGTVVFRAGDPVPNLAESEDPEDTGQKAFDYRTEPLWVRMGFAPNAELGLTRTFDFTHSLTNAQVGGTLPETPILEAKPGAEVRVRVLQSGGHARNHVFNLHGHVWEELPYVDESLALGSNPLSEWKGGRDLHGPGNHHDVIVKHGAGGRFGVPGYYLYRDQPSFQFDGGLWGLLHVASNSVIGGGVGGAGAAAGACAVDAASGETVCSPE